MSVLNHTPFRDFLIPGVVLLLVNGLFSLLVIGAMFFAVQQYLLLIVAEGCVLTSWIHIQYFWTQTYHPLQAVMGTVGLLLMACGYLLVKEENTALQVGAF